MNQTLLSVRNLCVSLRSRGVPRPLVQALDFDLAAGEIVGLAGQSGSGKTLTARALMGLLPAQTMQVDSDRLRLESTDLARLGEGAWRQLRGPRMAMIFQDPAAALDPVFTVGSQVSFAASRSQRRGARSPTVVAMDALAAVGFSKPREVYNRYPHELSGGMRQLCMIAMAVAARPALLLADEPTTALDVTTQARVLHLLHELREVSNTSILLISHDLGVLAQCASRIMVMCDGRLVEQAPTAEVFARPAHAHTAELLAALPRLDAVDAKSPVLADAAQPPLLEVQALSVAYGGQRRGRQQRRVAVDGVSFSIRPGEVFGLAGESGSGKSSLARSLLGLVQPAGGAMRFDGSILDADDRRDPELRRRMQVVFQDPATSLSPRRTIEQTLREPLEHFAIGTPSGHRDAMVEALETVGLEASALERFPHQFSSGQRQRIAIARALLPDPDLLIADEAVAALDVAVQARVLELLKRLRRERGIAMLFISHDLAVIRQLADTVGMMYRGRLVELAPANALFQSPLHPYTRQLLDSLPSPDRPLAPPGKGIALATAHPPAGCRFRLDCPSAMPVCQAEAPRILEVPERGTHRVECHLHDPAKT